MVGDEDDDDGEGKGNEWLYYGPSIHRSRVGNDHQRYYIVDVSGRPEHRRRRQCFINAVACRLTRWLVGHSIRQLKESEVRILCFFFHFNALLTSYAKDPTHISTMATGRAHKVCDLGHSSCTCLILAVSLLSDICLVATQCVPTICCV